MNNNSYKSRSNLLKGIGTLCLFIFFGYYTYQDTLNRNRLERSLNENAARQQRNSGYPSAGPHRNPDCPSAQPHPSASAKEEASCMNASKTTQHAAPEGLNAYDTFHENLDDFLCDPEDEQTYPPEIFDDQMDETEDEYDQPEFEY